MPAFFFAPYNRTNLVTLGNKMPDDSSAHFCGYASNCKHVFLQRQALPA